MFCVKNVTSFRADNAPVNFGSRQQRGAGNVFNGLPEQTLLIRISYPKHILHDAAEKKVKDF